MYEWGKDIKPKKYGPGGYFTLINKSGHTFTFKPGNYSQPQSRVLWNKVLGSDFTTDKIKNVDYYNKVQYYQIKKHNEKIKEQQSPFSQVMDALVTRLTVGATGMEMAPELAKLGFLVAGVGAWAIARTRAAIYEYNKARLLKVKNLKPKGQIELEMERLENFQNRTSSEVVERIPLISEQPVIKTDVVRKLRNKKIVHRKVKTKRLTNKQKLQETSFIESNVKETNFIQPVRGETGPTGYVKPKP